jgi:hypothetical protein
MPDLLEEQKRQSKPLHQLVVEVRFKVNRAYGSSRTALVGNFRDGGGHVSRTLLSVTPDDATLPITTLEFKGGSHVEGGDYISAQIPRCDHHAIWDRSGGEKILYSSRTEFNQTEVALQIDKFSPDRQSVVRTEYCCDYDKITQGEQSF